MKPSPTRISIQPFQPELISKGWGEEWIVARTPTTMAKVLKMRAGTSGDFQYHERKDECFWLMQGTAEVRYLNTAGDVVTTRMKRGEAYYVPPGAPHKVTALTDCILIESSTVHYGDRVSVSHLYAEPDREDAHRR